MTRMPFGCHRGEPLDEIDEQYLDWLLTLTNLSPPLRRAVARQLELQDRPDWLESAAVALPRVVWFWANRMRFRYQNNPAALAIVEQGLAVLKELCSDVTGQHWPQEDADPT